MNRRFGLTVVTVFFLSVLTSCNIFEGFADPSNDEEYIQEAQKCLREGNYTCALDNFGRISNTDLKNEKVCLTHMTRAGLGISELVNTIASESSGSSMLGRLATQLMPWTEEKETATTTAITECNKLSTISDTQKQSLLRVLAYMSDCAIRMAKTDLWIAVSEGGTTTCNATTAGDGDGDLENSDIVVNAGAGLSGVNSGMCEADVHACATDLDAANTLSSGLGGDLGDVSQNISSVPAALKNTAETTVNIRAAILSTL